jgi:NAD(P) transhydrogenase
MGKLDIEFHWRERVSACDAPPDGPVRLTLLSGAELKVDAVLVAAGRASRTEALNPDAAGLSVAKRGLLDVDEHYRTTVKHIYAAGDVIGFPALASTSMDQARVAVCHAFDVAGQPKVSPVLPYGIYTIPEVSMAGETEGMLKGQGVDYAAGKVPYQRVARGKIIGDEDGFLKLLYRRSDRRLLGVHVIGEQASELVHVGLMGLLTGASADLFEGACFNYPTLGELYKLATRAAFPDGAR